MYQGKVLAKLGGHVAGCFQRLETGHPDSSKVWKYVFRMFSVRFAMRVGGLIVHDATDRLRFDLGASIWPL